MKMRTLKTAGAMAILVIVMTAQSVFAYYNPSTGRWLSRDPIGERGGVNAYAFIKNDAADYFDKYGKKCCLITYPSGTVPGGYSQGGHSALKCDDGTYISAFPTIQGDAGGDFWTYPVDWRTEKEDLATYGKPKSIFCSDCIDAKKVAAWFSPLATHTPTFCGFTNNCADYTLQAITAGLQAEQVHPQCQCNAFVIYGEVDLLDPTGLSTPGTTQSVLKALTENNCQRFKCKLLSVARDQQ